MKKLIIALASISFVLTMNAQDETAPAAAAPAAEPAEETSPWTREGLFNLSLSQTALINWAAGGQNSYSGNALLKYSANYKKGLWKWKNDIALSYGGLAQGDIPWQKTDDRLEFNSKVSRDAKGPWSYAAFVNFRTQFMDGFELPDDSNIISTWMAPGYLTFGIGMDYTPNEYFTANISPVAGKFTFVTNTALANAGAFGVDAAEFDEVTGEKTKDGAAYRFELGGNVSLQFKKEIVKNVELDTKLNLFSNYLEEPGNIDVNWDLMLNMKVNDWLSASLIMNLIYDHDIDIAVDDNNDGVLEGLGPRTQVKEVLGAGLNMKF